MHEYRAGGNYRITKEGGDGRKKLLTWAKHAFAPELRGLREHYCAPCQAGETDICLRDFPDYGGVCPIKDKTPPFSYRNAEALQLFNLAQGTAEQITEEKGVAYRVHVYVKPAEIEALMRMHEVPEEERAELLKRVLLLQDVANEKRPARPKKRGPRP